MLTRYKDDENCSNSNLDVKLMQITRNARIKIVAMMVMAVKEYLTHTQLNIRDCDML